MQHVGGMAERRESKKVMKFEERNWKAEFVIYCTDVIGKCWRQTRLEGKTVYIEGKSLEYALFEVAIRCITGKVG